MASRPREVSYAGPQFGGGHGAFSYFLLNTLNGAADYDQDGLVVVDDVIDYVREKVAEGTWPKTPKIYPRALAWPERYPVAGKAPKRSGCTPRSSRPFRTTWPPASPWRSYTKNRAIPRRRLNSSIRRARQPENAVIFEQIGDLEQARGRTPQASDAYESALHYAPDRKTKKRLRRKRKR